MGNQSSAGHGDTVALLGNVIDAPKLGFVRGLDGPSLIVISRSSGKIQSVQRDSEATNAASALEATGVEVIRLGRREYLLPGFVDCHVHCSQWAYMGTGIDKPLMADDGFLAKYAFPSESSLNAQSAGAVYKVALDDMLRNGTTTALVFGSNRLDASEQYVAAALERGGHRVPEHGRGIPRQLLQRQPHGRGRELRGVGVLVHEELQA